MRNGATDVELGREAVLRAVAGDVEGVALGLEVGAGDVELTLQAAKLDVVAGDLGQDGEENVALVFDGGLEVGVGGFDPAARASEYVDLPRGVEFELVEVELRRKGGAGNGAAAGLTGLGVGGDAAATEAGDAVLADAGVLVSGVEIERRVEAGAGDDALGAGFDDPGAGLAKIEISADGAVDQRVEHGVVERRPPLGDLDRAGGGDAGAGGCGGAEIAPGGGEGALGRAVVGAYGAGEGRQKAKGKGQKEEKML